MMLQVPGAPKSYHVIWWNQNNGTLPAVQLLALSGHSTRDLQFGAWFLHISVKIGGSRAMADQIAFETYEARLASFSVAYPLGKKKGSGKGTKHIKWPHKSPTPAQVSTIVLLSSRVSAEMSQLAYAGFFYHPTDQSPDNTSCFICRSNLDGWEAGDHAIVEHLKHAPKCGWAINVAIESEKEDGIDILGNLSAECLLNARIMTFGSNWPHENKRGWTCKIGKVESSSPWERIMLTTSTKMAASGWFYCPIPENDDYVRCAYCNLALAGWEPKDDP